MTSFIYTNCTVGEVTRISDFGFGLDILNKHMQPILSLAFKGHVRQCGVIFGCS